MGNVIWKIIYCYYVISLSVSRFDYRQKVTKTSKKHKFLLCHSLFLHYKFYYSLNIFLIQYVMHWHTEDTISHFVCIR